MNVLRKLKTSLILLFVLILLQTLSNNSFGGNTNTVIINEIFFDPIGADSGKEWIELYNYGESDVYADNWRIMVAGSWYTESSKFSGIIPAKSYYLICESSVEGCNVNVSKIAMQNGGGNTDALSINDKNNIPIDQVFYDSPNTNALIDFRGYVVTQTAVIGINGESLGRINHIDTDNSFNDFVVFKLPTPGTTNKGSIAEDEIPQTGNGIFDIKILPILIFSGILLYTIKLYLSKNDKNQQEIK